MARKRTTGLFSEVGSIEPATGGAPKAPKVDRRRDKYNRLSEERMSGVNDKYLAIAQGILDDQPLLKDGYYVSVGHQGGGRTAEEQLALFKKGKSQRDGTKGHESHHQLGSGMDFMIYDKKGNPVYPKRDTPEWELYGQLHNEFNNRAGKQGYKTEWGGSWKSFDDPYHIQINNLGEDLERATRNAETVPMLEGSPGLLKPAGPKYEPAFNEAPRVIQNKNNIGSFAEGGQLPQNNNMKNNKQYGVGGDLLSGAGQGASLGASIGSVFPGIGTAIGAGVGALVGAGGKAITGHVKKKEAENLEQNQPMQPFSVGNNNHMFAQGGDFSEIDAGGTHEQNPRGGVPMPNNASVEEGETKMGSRVFSNRLVNPQTGNTFADDSKKYVDSKRPNDPISQRYTDKQLDELFGMQESMKPQEAPQPQQGQNQMFGGGDWMNTALDGAYNAQYQYNLDNPIYPQGVGGTSGFNNTALDGAYNAQNQYNLENPIYPDGRTNVDFSQHNPEFNYETNGLGDDMVGLTPKSVNIPKVESNLGIMKTEAPLDAGQIGADPTGEVDEFGMPTGAKFSPLRYAPIAGDVANLAMTLANKPKPKDLNMFDSSMNLDPNLVNREQIQRDIRSQAGATRELLPDATRGNAGNYLANLQGANLNTSKAIGQASLASNIADSTELGRVQQLKLSQDMGNKRNQMGVANMNDADSAAYQSSLMDSTANLAQNIGGVGTEQTNKSIVDQIYGYNTKGIYKQLISDYQAYKKAEGKDAMKFEEWVQSTKTS